MQVVESLKTWRAPFFRWKSTEELCLMTLKSDEGIWWILMQAVASLKICTLLS